MDSAAKVDRLLHDAEHADIGAEFARRMGHHARAVRFESERHDRLERAKRLDPDRSAPAWRECRLTQAEETTQAATETPSNA